MELLLLLLECLFFVIGMTCFILAMQGDDEKRTLDY